MTRPASKLTLGANREPQTLASLVHGTVELAVASGVDRAALIERMGIDEKALTIPEHWVPYETQVVAWEMIGALPNAETLGIELARAINPDALGVVGWAMANAPTGRDVVESIRRYNTLFGDPNAPDIDLDATTMALHQVWDPRAARTRVMAEFALGATVVLLRELLAIGADEPLATGVWLQHPSPKDPSLHHAFFGTAVRWSAPATRLAFARSAIDRPLVRRSASLYEHLDRHVRSLTPPANDRSSMTDRVHDQIVGSLRSGEPSAAGVARLLGTSERTLQRRLKEEDSSFAGILDGVRRSLAERYLSDESLAVYEVAFLLGYSETSAFHRAFKRWTGVGPQEHRARTRSR